MILPRSHLRRVLLAIVTIALLAGACGGSDEAPAPGAAVGDEAGGPGPGAEAGGPGDGSVDAGLVVDDPGDGVIKPVIVASRTSGPAPLAVHFDAIGTTHSAAGRDTFREVVYTFAFGDPGSGDWAVSGRPKNTQAGGPLAAHVFDAPGTYTVGVTVTDGTSRATKTVSITVTSPEAHWPGSKTIVVSPSSDFTGAPAGAEQRTTLPPSYDGRRVLLHRGEAFGQIAIASSDDDVLVGTYGGGHKPTVSGVRLDGGGSTADWPDEITVMDVAIGSGGFDLYTTGSRILVYRCDIDTPSSSEAQINIASALGYTASHGTLPASSYYWPREIFVVDSKVEGNVDATGQPLLVCMGYFARSAIMGNTMNKATEHTLRIWAAHRLFIGHNAFGGEHYAPTPPGIRGAMKIHSGGVAAFEDNLGAAGTSVSTRYLVIADNTIGSAAYPGSWTAGVGPQNVDPGTIEPVIDVLIENNTFLRGPFTSQDVHLLAQRCTTRGNVVLGGGTFGGDAVTAAESSADPGMAPYLGPYFGQVQ